METSVSPRPARGCLLTSGLALPWAVSPEQPLPAQALLFCSLLRLSVSSLKKTE